MTELLGHGVNYVTGDYSRGAGRLLDREGRINMPSRRSPSPATCANMFRNIVAVGNDALPRAPSCAVLALISA